MVSEIFLFSGDKAGRQKRKKIEDEFGIYFLKVIVIKINNDVALIYMRWI